MQNCMPINKSFDTNDLNIFISIYARTTGTALNNSFLLLSHICGLIKHRSASSGINKTFFDEASRRQKKSQAQSFVFSVEAASRKSQQFNNLRPTISIIQSAAKLRALVPFNCLQTWFCQESGK